MPCALPVHGECVLNLTIIIINEQDTITDKTCARSNAGKSYRFTVARLSHINSACLICGHSKSDQEHVSSHLRSCWQSITNLQIQNLSVAQHCTAYTNNKKLARVHISSADTSRMLICLQRGDIYWWGHRVLWCRQRVRIRSWLSFLTRT